MFSDFATCNGVQVVSGSEDNSVHVWDLQTQDTVQVLQGHKCVPISVSCHPRAAILATSTLEPENAIVLWGDDSAAALPDIATEAPAAFGGGATGSSAGAATSAAPATPETAPTAAAAAAPPAAAVAPVAAPAPAPAAPPLAEDPQQPAQAAAAAPAHAPPTAAAAAAPAAGSHTLAASDSAAPAPAPAAASTAQHGNEPQASAPATQGASSSTQGGVKRPREEGDSPDAQEGVAKAPKQD